MHLLFFCKYICVYIILLIMNNDIKAYDTYRCKTFGEKGMPENIRHELNIDSLCEKIDFTSSCIGRQYLYYIVCKDEISGIRNNESLIKELHDNVSLRKVSFHHTISPYLSYTHFCKQQRRLQKSAYLPIRIKTSIITSTI